MEVAWPNVKGDNTGHVRWIHLVACPVASSVVSDVVLQSQHPAVAWFAVRLTIDWPARVQDAGLQHSYNQPVGLSETERTTARTHP